MSGRTRPRVALVVPNLTGGGGVQAVARFVKDVAVRSGRFDLQAVSLPESSRDPASLRVTSPGSWLRSPQTVGGEWDGVPCVHVGAVAAELEFQRYRPRKALTRVLSDCDIIQVVCGFPAWANAVLGTGKPVSVHAATRARVERRQRDARPRHPLDWWRRAMTSVTDRLDDRALRRADAVQVMNPWMLEYAKSVNAGRQVDVRYLPPGVNTERFRPRDAGGQADAGSVLCVGRLNDPRKNLTLLLEACALLPAGTGPRVDLIMAGSTPPPEAFWQRAGALGLRDRVTYVSRPDDGTLLRLYQSASVFVLPSDEEGFGMVLLEAMACGVPVISTRSGGPEGIITDGEDGYLVDRGDAPAMAARMAALLREPALAAGIGSRARRTIERRYDERVVGDAFIGIWDRLARGSGAA